MYYRLSCITADGELCGYQWCENISPQLFQSVAQGQRPLGDQDAQTRNSPTVNANFDGSPVYYGHVWLGGWITDQSAEQAAELYALAAQPEPGA